MESPKLTNKEHNKQLKDVHELDEKIEQFYNKPETDEELTRRVGIIREIPDDINTPKVLLKLGDPTRPDKFVHMRDEDGREYVIALPIEKRAYHRDVANFCRQLYKKDLKVIGGGYIKQENGKIVVYGQSQDFGEANKETVKAIIQQALPDVEIEAVSLKSEEVSRKRKDYTDALEKITSEVGKDLYANVVERKGIRMGYDMATRPQTVEGSHDDMAWMIYRSENGRSFGMDTLFLGYKDKNHTLNTKELAQTRWNLSVRDAKIENDVLILTFESDGQAHTISQPIDILDNLEMFSNLGEFENQILDYYKQFQFAWHDDDHTVLHSA